MVARHNKAVSHSKPQSLRSRAAQSRAANLDRLIHEPIRLGIVSALARKLEETQYVGCEKYFEGRLPKTEYRLTSAGRKALETYLDHMEALIRATRES